MGAQFPQAQVRTLMGMGMPQTSSLFLVCFVVIAGA